MKAFISSSHEILSYRSHFPFVLLSLLLLTSGCKPLIFDSNVEYKATKTGNLKARGSSASDPFQAKGSCYWMENYSGNYYWIPASEVGVIKDIYQCYVLDSCDGGLGRSGGGCYKWAESPDGPRAPWPAFDEDYEKPKPPVSASLEPCNQDRSKYRDWALKFTVKIISGTLAGSEFWGAANYQPEALQKLGTQNVELSDFAFCYIGPVIELSNFDPLYSSRPSLAIQDGRVVRINAIGGDGYRRFGFNGGFDRNQFGREEESFILKGEDYFGYLNPQTFVDGAGLISYDWP